MEGYDSTRERGEKGKGELCMGINSNPHFWILLSLCINLLYVVECFQSQALS
jgi:hypothetical protein